MNARRIALFIRMAFMLAVALCGVVPAVTPSRR
jgi:hypothetical protein